MTKPLGNTKTHLSVFVPNELKEKLEAEADAEIKSITQKVREILENHFKDKDE